MFEFNMKQIVNQFWKLLIFVVVVLLNCCQLVQPHDIVSTRRSFVQMRLPEDLRQFLPQQQIQNIVQQDISKVQPESEEIVYIVKKQRYPELKFLKDFCTDYTFVDPQCQGGGPQIHPPNKRDVNSTHYPYIISLQLQISEQCFFHFCAGTLIAPNVVLGPAHCFVLFDLEGETIFAAQAPQCRHEPGIGRVKVKKIIPREDFNVKNFANDFAIIFLEEDLPGPLIDIISSEKIKLETNSILGFVGYGLDENDFQFEDYEKIPLQGGFNLEFRPKKVCPVSVFVSDTIQICTSTFPFNNNGCVGDSGGPLLYLRGDRPIQIGTLSYVFEETDTSCNNGNAVYGKVSAYLPWIEKTSGIQFVKQPLSLAPAPPPPPPPPPAPMRLSSNDIQFLQIINQIRRSACAGYPLFWDFNLALESTIIVNQCTGFDSVGKKISVYFNSNLNISNSIEEIVLASISDQNGKDHFRIITSQTATRVGCDISYDCKFRDGDKFVLYVCAFDKPTPLEAPIPMCPNYPRIYKGDP